VATASNGTEALALLAESRFEAIITDLVMPNMDGLDLINLIRRQWPDMGVILMSGYIADNAGKAVLGRREAFLLKPVSPPDLIATVERVLSKRNASTSR
jgi:YesN/AraC family two-component response regulator